MSARWILHVRSGECPVSIDRISQVGEYKSLDDVPDECLSHVSACFTWWMKSIGKRAFNPMKNDDYVIVDTIVPVILHARTSSPHWVARIPPGDRQRECVWSAYEQSSPSKNSTYDREKTVIKCGGNFLDFLGVVERHGKSVDVYTYACVRVSISHRVILLTLAMLNYQHHRLLRQRKRIVSLSFQRYGTTQFNNG